MDRPSEFERGRSPASLVRTEPPFVGRRQHLERLTHCVQEAIAGHPRLILIAGEAGIGKTRLLKEVWSVALHHGVQICSGRCYEDLALPYLPFVESLLARLGQLPEDVERLLGAEVEVIRQLLHRDRNTPLAVPLPSSSHVDQHKLRLLLAVARATITLAQHCPLLLVMDDLHWADQPSLDLFGHLVFTVADTAVRESVPLLLMGTYRPEELKERLVRLITRFQREEVCQTLELLGLDEAETHELLRGLGLGRSSHQLVSVIRTATHGNPLFIQEVVHHLRQQGALQERGGYMVTTASAADLQLPKHVIDALVARMQGLSEGCRRLLTLAAFLGDHFLLRVLSAVSGVGEEEVLDMLDEGMHQHLLLSVGQAFQFAHPLIRHVFYNAPSAMRRQRIHQQIAQALERLYADSLEVHVLEIAHHLIRAGSITAAEKVVQYARRAGDQAFGIAAWNDAARYYEAALSAVAPTACLSVYEQAELHYRAGLARYRDMDAGPCRDHYEKAIAAYRLTDDVQGLARVLLEQTRLLYTLAPVPYGTLVDVRPLEEVCEALGDREPRLHGRIAAIMSQVYWHGKQPDKAEELAWRALEIGQHLKDAPLCAEATGGLALAQMQSLRVREALGSWQSGLAYARQTDDLWLQGLRLQRIPWALIWLGRLDEAETVALEAETLVRQTHDWAEYSLSLAALVAVAVARGNFEVAERQAQETMRMVQRSHYPWGGAAALPALAGAHTLRGAWTAAEDAINMLVEPGRVFAEVGPTLQAGAQTYRQLVRAYAGAVEEVREQLAAHPPRSMGKERVDVLSLARFCALVEIADLTATPPLAESLYETLLLAAEQGVVFSSSWVFLIPRVLGIAATLNRWWDKAEAHLQVAIEVATGAGARPELGRAYLDYARLLVARGTGSDRQRTFELVKQAEPIFAELGMIPFARRAAQLAEVLETRGPLAWRQRAADPDQRSAREAEVLLRIARGRTNFLG